MGMQDIRLDLGNDCKQTSCQAVDHRHLIQHRESVQVTTIFWCTKEFPVIHRFFQLLATCLLFACHMKSLPSHGTLRLKYRQSAESIATMQRQGMIKYVQDAHQSEIMGELKLWRAADNS